MSRQTRLNQPVRAGDAGSVFTSPTTNVTLNKTGIYIPPDWGNIWRPKLAAAIAGTGLARIGVVGASVGQGYWASVLKTKSYPALLKIAGQTMGGNGGSGYDGMQFSSTFLAGAGSPAATAWASAGDSWTQTGTWSTPSTGAYGPSIGLLLGGASGSTVTRTVNGTTVEVVYFDQTGPFNVTIDGGAATTVTPGTSAAFVSRLFTGLSTGNHTVVITANTATGPYLAGFSGTAATGVRLDNYCIAGAESGMISRVNSDATFAGEYIAGWRRPVDLLIVDMCGGNDFINATRTFSATTTSGSNVISCVPPNGFAMMHSVYPRTISGTGIPAGATITGINVGTSLTLSAPATASGTVTVTVTNPNPVEAWAVNMESYMQGVMDGAGGAGTYGVTDVIFVLTPAQIAADLKYTLGSMSAKVWSFANAYGAAVVDVGAPFRRSWNKWQAAGYAGNSASVGTAGSDPVHASDAGHAYINSMLQPLVLATS